MVHHALDGVGVGLTASQLTTGGTVIPTTVVTNAAAGTGVAPASVVTKRNPGAAGATAATLIRKMPLSHGFSWAIECGNGQSSRARAEATATVT